jgi:hypothetical protein
VVHGSRFTVYRSRLVVSGWWLVISEWLSVVHDEIRSLSTTNGDEPFRRRSSDIGHRSSVQEKACGSQQLWVNVVCSF